MENVHGKHCFHFHGLWVINIFIIDWEINKFEIFNLGRYSTRSLFDENLMIYDSYEREIYRNIIYNFPS